MRRTRGTVLALTAAASMALAWREGRESARAADTATASAAAPVAPPAPIESSRRTAIVTAAQRVSPAVVSVSVVGTRIVRQDPFGGMMRDPFFDQFFPPLAYRERVSGLGSGVIVDPNGLVLTNEHVVRDADDVRVTLTDGRQLKAKVLGQSPVYDLAVLKVEGKNLPTAELGRTDDLVVGEWAIAIGNPFGFLLDDTQPSVTAGVISATRRDIKSDMSDRGVYKHMIQTDAAINPGNSGGPLVNSEGKVIGINTFIFTSGGGSLGMGFAIPIEVAKKVLDEIRTYGRVRQAWLGMQVQELTQELAERLGYSEAGGLVVSRVDAGGPAAQAGIQRGDRIREVNGKKVQGAEDAQASIYGAGVGDTVSLVAERGTRTLNVQIKLVEAPATGGKSP